MTDPLQGHYGWSLRGRMRVKLIGISVGLIFSFSSMSLAAVKSYSCGDLESLRSSINKDSTKGQASVAAQLILRLADHATNSCLEKNFGIGQSVEIKYLDKGEIISDVFNFSTDNYLVSMVRLRRSGESEIINY